MVGLAAKRNLVSLTLVIFAALLYVNSAWNGFVLDDDILVRKNPLIRTFQNVPTLFVSDYWEPKMKGGLYRPLVTFSYAVNYSFGGLDPTGYHLVNIVLHALNSLLVLLLFRRLSGDEVISAAGAFFFAAHSVHTEAIANVAGRAELFCTFFFLSSLLFYIPARKEGSAESRNFYWASLGAYLLALLSKENALTLLGVILLYDVVYREERNGPFLRKVGRVATDRLRTAYLGFLLVTAAYFAMRFFVIQSVNPTTLLDNALTSLAPHWRILNAFQVAFRYLWLLFLPLHLSYDYSYNQIPLLLSFADPFSLLILGLTLVVFWLLIWAYRRSRDLFFAVGFTIITFSIVSNIVIPIGTIMGERLLYLPSVGFCLALSIALRRGFGKLHLPEKTAHAIFVGLMVVIVGLNGWRTVMRNRDWASEQRLFLADLPVSPRSAKVQRNAGVIFLQKLGQHEDALKAFEEAARIMPWRKSSQARVGHTLLTIGREAEAIKVYEKLVRSGWVDRRVYNNLGYLLVERKIDVPRGISLLEKILKKHPKDPSVLDSLGWAYYRVGRLREGHDLIKQSLRLDDSGKSGETRRAHLKEIERAMKASQLRPSATPP